MSHAFEVSNGFPAALVGLDGYKANIEGFNAVYGFESEDNAVQAAAIFETARWLCRC